MDRRPTYGELETRLLELEQEAEKRREAEQALRESEERLREFAELLPENVCETDAMGNIVFANRSAFRVFGYTQEDVQKGLNALQMMIPQDRDRAAENIGKVLNGEELGGNEYIALKKDGGSFPVVIYANPVIRHGSPAGMRVIIVDITNRKRAEEALRESEARYRMLFDNSTDGIATASLQGRIIDTNQAFQEMLGYSRMELQNKNIRDITPREWHALEARSIRELIHRGGAGHAEIDKEYIRKDCKVISVSVSGTVIRDRHGIPEKLVAFVRDITERKRAEEELHNYQEHLEELVEERTAKLKQEIAERTAIEDRFKKLNEDLEERVRARTRELEKAYEELKKLDEMKDAFLSSVSHELRTPLTSIRSFSEILLRYEPDDPHTRTEFIDIINSESERLTRLINDLLDLARIEAGEMVWNDHLLSLQSVVNDAAKAHGQLLNDRALGLTLDVPQNLPSVLADRDRIHQVLTNLLGNAIKFSFDGGEIRIKAETVRDDPSGNNSESLLVSLSDQGMGIEEKDFEAIFDRFRQVSRDSLREKPRGTGLGLPITREIISRYGGRLWVESVTGKGSTFFFTLPVAAPTAQLARPTSLALEKIQA